MHRAELPAKIANQGTIPIVDRVSVLLNGCRMDISHAVSEVFEFQIKFIGIRLSQPKEGKEAQTIMKDLAIGPKNDESKETRRRLLWDLLHQLIDKNQGFFGSEKKSFTYDCGQLLYCKNNLGLKLGSPAREFMLQYDPDTLEERCRAYIHRYEPIKVTILRTGTVNLRNAPAAYIQGDRSVVQFLDILSSQRIYEQKTHYCFGNRMYEASSSVQLGSDPRVLKEGMQKDVRFVGDNPQNAGPILQLDAKKSTFYPEMELVEFVGKLVNIHPNNLQHAWQRDGNLFEQINREIKGVILVTTHLDTPQIFPSQGLIDESPQRQSFERDGQQFTVQQYFSEVYRHNLRYPRLSCVIQRKPHGESYYPMEVLRIVEGQRVPIEKQTHLTEQIIKQCQVLPANLAEQIHRQQVHAMAQTANPFFRAHNVRIESELIRTDAQRLHLPAIEYSNNEKVEPEPNRGLSNWRTIVPDGTRRTFIEPAEFYKTWVVVIVQNCVPRAACNNFCTKFVQTAVSRGLADCEMPPRVEVWNQTDREFVEERFKFLCDHKCMFLLCFAPGKKDAKPGDIHHLIKYMEAQYDVPTQHISPEITKKGAEGGGGAAMVLENIMMKTNLKLGGANYGLTTSNMFKQAVRNQQDTLGQVWLSGKRMFIGIDFSHAPPQSLYDRKTKKAPANPTVVGMAYTYDKMMLKMRGNCWAQQARKATMTGTAMIPLIDNIRKALGWYEAQNDGKYPDHIIVFRGGASEGEFETISSWEGISFLKAFDQLAALKGDKFKPPAVTIVVCQRQSNYRIIPSNINPQAKAPEQNVQPGTVVDKGVMNAAVTEFLLVAHKALQGTANPVRCSVVYEWRPPKGMGPASHFPARIPLEELENITNALCWSHGICAGSTATPGVLYAAGELAKRGRNNWRMHTFGGANVQHFEIPHFGEEGPAAEQAQQQLDDQQAQYFAQIPLGSGVPTKYWA